MSRNYDNNLHRVNSFVTNNAICLATYATFKLNGQSVTFGGNDIPSNSEFNFWLVGTFTATVNLQTGTNTFVITSSGTALNVDYVEVR